MSRLSNNFEINKENHKPKLSNPTWISQATKSRGGGEGREKAASKHTEDP